MMDLQPDHINCLTWQEILAGLQRLGIRRGEVLGVHSSLSSLGYVEGGAQAVLQALFEAVSPQGAIVMSTYLVGPPLPLTPADEALGITWKIRRLAFEDITTPTGMGAISDAFRRRPDVVRWYHPVHSVTAWGRDASRFCQGFKPLVEAGGRILLLGVQMDRCSALHLAEEMVPLPPEIQQVKRWEVPQQALNIYPPDQWIIGCHGAWGDFLIVQSEAEKRGLITSTQIGSATARLFEAEPLIELYAELLRQDPHRMFGVRHDVVV